MDEDGRVNRAGCAYVQQGRFQMCRWFNLDSRLGPTKSDLSPAQTLEKTRALYLKWLGRSTPAKWNVADFEMSKMSKIVKIHENFSVLDFRDPYGTLKLILDYGLRDQPS